MSPSFRTQNESSVARLLGLGVLLLAWPCSAAAQWPGEFVTRLMIEPTQMLPSADQHVRPGEEILRQRILPAGLAKTTHDFGEGHDFLPAGSELFEASSSTAKIYCTFAIADLGHPGAKVKFFTLQLDFNALCFADANGRGRFDTYFKMHKFSTTLPIVQGFASKKSHAVDLPYVLADPASTTSIMNIVIENGRGNPLYHTPFLRVVTVFGNNRQDLSGNNVVLDQPLPADVSVVGAKMLITAAHDGVLDVNVATPIPPQVFRLGATPRRR